MATTTAIGQRQIRRSSLKDARKRQNQVATNTLKKKKVIVVLPRRPLLKTDNQPTAFELQRKKYERDMGATLPLSLSEARLKFERQKQVLDELRSSEEWKSADVLKKKTMQDSVVMNLAVRKYELEKSRFMTKMTKEQYFMSLAIEFEAMKRAIDGLGTIVGRVEGWVGVQGEYSVGFGTQG